MVKKVVLAGIVVLIICFCGCKKSTPSNQEKQAAEPAEAAKTENKYNVPWQDGEMLKLKVTSLEGEEIGMFSFKTELETKGENDFWKLSSYNYLSTSDSQQYSQVEANTKDFRPISSHVVNLLGDFQARYEPNKIKLISDSLEGKKEKVFDVNGAVYDNEQIIHLLRLEPLDENYKKNFKVFSGMNGKILNYSVETAGKEQVDVSAGKFDCFRLNMKMSADGVEPLEHSIWISADQHRYLVKYIASMSAIMELQQVMQVAKNSPAVYKNEQLGCGFALPPDWEYYEHIAGAIYFIELFSPELKARGALGVLPSGEGRDDAKEIARSDSEKFKGLLEKFSLRGEVTETTVSGVKASQYIADFEESVNALCEIY